MNELRRSLGWLFGIVTFLTGSGTVSVLAKTPNLWHADVSVAFMLLATGLNAIACWTVLAHKPSGRIFGLIASTFPLVGLGLISLLWRIKYSVQFDTPPATILLTIIGLAVVGLVAFLPRNATVRPPGNIPTSAPMVGDGTNAFINKAVIVAGTLAFFFGIDPLWRWGMHQGLSGGGGSFFLQLIVADIFVVLVHELGHTITGLALGMKMRAFIVGAFQWHIHEGRWKFKFRPAAFLMSGGATTLVPTNPRQARSEYICMVAAGPFVSLALGVIALCAVFAAPGSQWESAWQFLACVAVISLIAAVVNLIPFQTGTTYSDGAYLYQLLSNGPWADLHHAFSVASATVVTPLRPRDYDIEAIQRASAAITQGHRAMQLQFMTSSYHLDCGRYPEAAAALAEAETIFHDSASYIPAELYPWFIYRKALLQGDAVGAREWWNNMTAKKQIKPNANYWLAQSALFWIENQPSEALEAWEKAYSVLQTLPECGDTDFDKDRLNRLRKAMNGENIDNAEVEFS